MFDDPQQNPTPKLVPMASSGTDEAPVPAAPAPAAKPVAKTGPKPAFSAPAKKIGKDVTPQKKSARFLITIGMTLVGLFVLFVVLMVLVIAGGGQESPVLKALGLDTAGIKSFLLTVINLSFGFLALLFFVFVVIGIFRWLFAKKGDKEMRGRGIRMFLVGLIPMIIIMFLWLILFNFINRIEIASAIGKEEITVLSPASPDNLVAPIEITFTAENVIKAIQRQKGQITDVKWDFNGDGAYETQDTNAPISYLFTTKGNFNVGLQVTVAGEDKPRIYNLLIPIKDALFGADPAGGTAPLAVQFDASNLIPAGKKMQTLDWDFDGDGTYDVTGKDQIRPRYTFEKVGKFTVHLRMVDENNVVQNFNRDIDVTLSEKPLLSATIDATPGLSGQIPLQVQFDGSKSESLKGQITRYEWNFGDGSALQVGRSVAHVFSNPGLYTVTLKVADDTGLESITTAQAEAKAISSAPEAKITSTPAADETGSVKGNVPLKVAFDASGSTDSDKNIVDYEWDFGIEGAKQTGQKVEYTFEKAGTYTVSLTVRDSTKLESKATETVTVAEPGVSAVIKATPEEGTAPLNVQFDGSSSSTFKGSIVSYEWSFGDKSPATITGAQITHKYNDVGTYTVKLKVVTNQNESGSTEKLVYVREIPLKACFAPSRHNGLAPLTVTFDSKCATGPVAKFTWTFGDGETSDTRKPNHTFENPGTYNVTLEVADDKSNVSTYNDVIVAEGNVKPADNTTPTNP
jgi:PKD repeat protein